MAAIWDVVEGSLRYLLTLHHRYADLGIFSVSFGVYLRVRLVQFLRLFYLLMSNRSL